MRSAGSSSVVRRASNSATTITTSATGRTRGSRLSAQAVSAAAGSAAPISQRRLASANGWYSAPMAL